LAASAACFEDASTRRGELPTDEPTIPANTDGGVTRKGGGPTAGDGGGDVDEDRTIIEVLEANPDLSELTKAIKAQKLDGLLDGPGTFTLFAPSNKAMRELNDLVAKGDVDAKEVASILSYHLLVSKNASSDLIKGSKIYDTAMSVERSPVKVAVSIVGSNVVLNNGRSHQAQVTKADIAATNGVIHVIDHVIHFGDEPTTIEATLGELAAATTIPGPVKASLTKVSCPTKCTVFAPKSGTLSDDNAKYHVVQAAAPLYAAGVVGAAGGYVKTLDSEAGVGISVNSDGSVMLNKGKPNAARVTTTDILATNGVIHLIDRPLSRTEKTKNILETMSDVGLKQLGKAVSMQGSDSEFNDRDQSITVFAPNDAAIESIAELTARKKPELKTVLLYHTAPSVYSSQKLASVTELDSFIANKKIRATRSANPAFTFLNPSGTTPSVNDAYIDDKSDIVATNGIIHVITKVLTPP